MSTLWKTNHLVQLRLKELVKVISFKANTDKIAKQDFAGWPNNDIPWMYFYFGIINYWNWNWKQDKCKKDFKKEGEKSIAFAIALILEP